MAKLRWRSRILLGAFVAASSTALHAADAPMSGFSTDGAAAERAIESTFDKSLSASSIRTRLRQMSSTPNPVGSAHNKEIAYKTMQALQSWGWDAHIDSFDTLYPSPGRLELTLLGPKPFRANLNEPAIPGDAQTANKKGVLPAWFVYGGDGDVTAALVYVNYGLADDYDVLARMGIDVKGKIIIARYGGSWRGLKPKLAYEHGAVGCILYSDPADDGYAQGDVYPKGAWRPSHSVQRGSIIDLPVQPGDPLRPEPAPGEQPQTLAPDLAAAILKIPALPISYADAQHFLVTLQGPVAPSGWHGALPITYHVGPGNTRVHLVVHNKWSKTAFYNVVATMKGSVWPDEWIIRGNNRDTWVYGTWDSLSGHSVMLEEAKAIGALARSGWRPKRTIVYASWDGEEAGMIGSTDWTRKNVVDIQNKAALYINSGPNGRGFLDASASYALDPFINEVAADVLDPESHTSIRNRAFASYEVQSLDAGGLKATETLSATGLAAGDVPIGALGAGSDYTSFVHHLGIASIDIGFRGEDLSFPVGHSAYDDVQHFERFSDPNYAYAVALAETAGRLVLRSTQADVLPMNPSVLVDKVDAQIAELDETVAAAREHSKSVEALLDQGAFGLAGDPEKKKLAPGRQGDVPAVDLGPLRDAAGALRKSAAAFEEASPRATSLPSEQRVRLNAILRQLEQRLIDPKGLPGRPWYRHLLYDPGMRTGYAPATLPGVREAIEAGRWSEANDYIGRTAKSLRDYASGLDEATALLRQ